MVMVMSLDGHEIFNDILDVKLNWKKKSADFHPQWSPSFRWCARYLRFRVLSVTRSLDRSGSEWSIHGVSLRIGDEPPNDFSATMAILFWRTMIYWFIYGFIYGFRFLLVLFSDKTIYDVIERYLGIASFGRFFSPKHEHHEHLGLRDWRGSQHCQHSLTFFHPHPHPTPPSAQDFPTTLGQV